MYNVFQAQIAKWRSKRRERSRAGCADFHQIGEIRSTHRRLRHDAPMCAVTALSQCMPSGACQTLAAAYHTPRFARGVRRNTPIAARSGDALQWIKSRHARSADRQALRVTGASHRPLNSRLASRAADTRAESRCVFRTRDRRAADISHEKRRVDHRWLLRMSRRTPSFPRFERCDPAPAACRRDVHRRIARTGRIKPAHSRCATRAVPATQRCRQPVMRATVTAHGFVRIGMSSHAADATIDF
jgi:hypothetical protein